MSEVELIMPKMGESVAEATIIKWLKAEGEKVEADEAVLEIATDKVDSEIPSPSEGIITKHLYQEGDVVKVGQAIAIISSDAAEPVTKEAPKSAPTINQNGNGISKPSPAPVADATSNSPHNIAKKSASGKFFSPLVRKIAKEEGVGMQELENMAGSGKNGRITKNDILSYLPGRNQNESTSTPTQTTPTKTITSSSPTPSTTSVSGNSEIVEMDRMRKLIAEHMVMSKHTSPHVTSFVEADVTNIVNWRNRIKDAFQKREGEKMTFTPIFIEAISKAIRDFPMINISVEGTNIIVHKNINVGMAAALPSGNLIVPVIKNADHLNLIGITKAVNDFANRARNNKLKPDEIQGGTFTLTNVGTFGNVMGTPIINQPQVAILATGSINKKPAVIEGPEGDSIGIRHMMFLSMSYDHRVVDGSLGGSFIRKVADYLEQFDINREI